MNESCSLDNWRKASNVSLSSHWCTAPESALCEEKATLTSLGCSTLKLPMHCLTLLRSNLGCTFADQLHCTVTPPLLCGLANASEGAAMHRREQSVGGCVDAHAQETPSGSSVTACSSSSSSTMLHNLLLPTHSARLLLQQSMCKAAVALAQCTCC